MIERQSLHAPHPQNLDVDLMVNLNDLAYVSVVIWEPSA